MKKKVFYSSLFFLVLILITSGQSLFAITLEADLNTSNFSLKNDGSYRKIPDFGCYISIEEEILPHFNAKLAFARDCELGNAIWTSFSYKSSVFDISLGPALYVLNSHVSFADSLSQVQPGLVIGMNVATDSGFILGFSGSFAISIVNMYENAAFLQTGVATIGYRFPNLLGNLKFSHKSKVGIVDGNKSFFSITDYGLYTETYYKPSRLRVPINIIFRHIKYDNNKAGGEKKNYGNILVETGFGIWFNSDVEMSFLAGSAIYSFSMGDDKYNIQQFFFRSKISLKVAL